MKKLLLIFLFGIILLSQAVLGANLPGDWWGKVEISGVDDTNGAVVNAYLNNNSKPVANATVGSLESQYYLIHVPGEKGDNVTFRVNNVSVEQEIQSWSKGEHSRLDLSVKIPESRTHSKSGLNLTKGQTSTIDASNETNTTLKIKSKNNITDTTISVVKYSKNPIKKEFGLSSLERYIGIEASPEVENNMEWTTIEVTYTDEEVSNVGVEENSLRLHYFNETAGDWEAYNPPKGGVDIEKDIVWANTSHFSIWGIFGNEEEQSEDTDDTGGGSGGGFMPPCEENWTCTDWSNCVEGTQTRNCTDQNECGSTENKPTTTQSCTVTCEPDWDCSDWSNCVNGTQSRDCQDLNNCGTEGKPSETQSCCEPDWTCTEWSECTDGTQTRTCTDQNECETEEGKPDESQSCEVEAGMTSTEGITGLITENGGTVLGGLVALVIIVGLAVYWKRR